MQPVVAADAKANQVFNVVVTVIFIEVVNVQFRVATPLIL